MLRAIAVLTLATGVMGASAVTGLGVGGGTVRAADQHFEPKHLEPMNFVGTAAPRPPAPSRSRVPLQLAQNQAVTPPVSRSIAPTPQRPQFELLRDRHIHGKDIEVIRNSTLADCQASCQKLSACVAAVFDKWNQWCFVKSEAARIALDAKYSTYLRSDASPKRSVTRAELQRFKGKAFPVSGGQQLTGLSQAACEARCDASAACTAFTHFASTSRCVLLSDPGEYASDPDATSGAKHQAN